MSQHIKTAEGYDVKVPSQGQVTLNTVLGAIGSYGALSGGMGGGCNNGGFLSNIFGGNRNCSGADAYVTRYEQALIQENAAKDSKIALLEANIFTDSKITETYKELRDNHPGLQ